MRIGFVVTDLAGGGKALLRELARRSLPQAVWDRPKHGFSVPLRELFNGAWRETAEDVIARCVSLVPFFKADAVLRPWHAARAGRSSRRLAYTFVVPLLWLEAHPLGS